jgi:hypothetical protein
MIQLTIDDGKDIYYPVVEDEISFDHEIKSVPGKLSFNVLKDSTLKITEGNVVRLIVDGVGVFFGFIFTLQHGKGNKIQVTAYDQLRYLKNKETYVYKNKTADEVVKMIASDFKLSVGTLANTSHKIKSRIEDNQTLIDIIQYALDETLRNKNKMYVLYDSFGKLTLKNIESMKLDLLIDDETAEDYDYSSSVDGETYNRIKLYRDNKKTGKRDVYIAESSANKNAWGILQFTDKLGENSNGKAKADALLSLYNRKLKTLSITNAFGDKRVRAGSSIVVVLNLDDVKLHNYMIVSKVTHKFKKDIHTMSMSLKGGLFT